VNVLIFIRIVPILKFTYILGSSILAVVFSWNLIVFWRSGFSIPLLTPPDGKQ
jgi:hypothetical protein